MGSFLELHPCMNQGTFVYRYDRDSGGEETAEQGESRLSVLEAVRERFDHRLHTRVSQHFEERVWIRDTILRRTIPEAEAALLHLDQPIEAFPGSETHPSSAVGNRSDFDFPGNRGFTQETREGSGDIAEPQQCDRKGRESIYD